MSVDNLRHAQYTSEGIQIDDPQSVKQSIVGSSSDQVAFQAMVSGAGSALVTYTLSGSSTASYCDASNYFTLSSIVIDGDTATLTSPGIGKTFRKGQELRIAGSSTFAINQFKTRVLDSSLDAGGQNWIKIDISGPHTTRDTGTAVEFFPINDGDYAPSSAKGFAAWAALELGNNFKCLGNYSVGGGNATELLDLFDSTIGVARPQVVLHHQPNNDPFSMSMTAAQMIALNTQYIEKIKSIGALPVIILYSPRAGSATAGQVANLLEANRWSIDNLPGMGCIIIDPSKATANGKTFVNQGASNPTLWQANTDFVISDLVHPDRAAGKGVGKLIANSLRDRVLPSLPITVNTYTQAAHQKTIFTNSLLSNSGGVALPAGWTGDLLPVGSSTSFTGAPTAVVTVTQRTFATDGDDYGNNLQIALSSVANSNQMWYSFVVPTPSIAAAEKYVGALLLKATAQAHVTAIRAFLGIRYNAESGGYATKTAEVLADAGNSGLNDDFDSPIRTPVLKWFDDTLPAVINRIELTIYVAFSATAGASGRCTLKIAQPSIFKVA